MLYNVVAPTTERDKLVAAMLAVPSEYLSSNSHDPAGVWFPFAAVKRNNSIGATVIVAAKRVGVVFALYPICVVNVGTPV